jgi:hypothetical protein
MKYSYWYNPQHTRGAYTSIVAAVCVGYPQMDTVKWSPSNIEIIAGLTKLWRQGETTYYGHL